MRPEQIDQVRRFNRLVTQRAGALDQNFLGRNRPLGESRVLFEIGNEGAELRDLRMRLGLDSGYLSRIIQSLSDHGLIRLRPGPSDDRVRRAYLTRKGRAEVDEMNRRSDRAAESILAPLTESQRERLVRAMSEIHGLLRAAAAHIAVVDPASPAARWCVAQYFAELGERFDRGFDPAHSIPADDDELRPPHGAFLLASADGEPLACGAVKAIAPRTGSLKRMWVASSARGLGLGRRLLEALETEAHALGLTTIRLETNRALTEAIQLYQSAGYAEVPAFNDEPYANHWFEKRLS